MYILALMYITNMKHYFAGLKSVELKFRRRLLAVSSRETFKGASPIDEELLRLGLITVISSTSTGEYSIFKISKHGKRLASKMLMSGVSCELPITLYNLRRLKRFRPTVLPQTPAKVSAGVKKLMPELSTTYPMHYPSEFL